MNENQKNLKNEFSSLIWYKKNVPKLSIIFGVIEIIIAIFLVELPRTRGLYIGIALGPIIMGIIAYIRYLYVKDEAGLAKVITETAWLPLSFGTGYFIMAPSSYYYANPGPLTATLIIAACMIILGLKTLITLAKKGFSLTP